jgi:hypothetical protein
MEEMAVMATVVQGLPVGISAECVIFPKTGMTKPSADGAEDPGQVANSGRDYAAQRQLWCRPRIFHSLATWQRR